MIFLDIKTLNLVLFCLQMVMGFMLLMMWRNHRQERCLPFWAAGNFCCGLGSALLVSQASANPLLGVIGGNILLQGAYAAFMLGYYRLLDKPLPWRVAVLLVTGTIVVLAVFKFAIPLLWVRIVVTSLGIAISSLMLIYIIVHTRRETSYSISPVFVGVFTIHAGFFLARAIEALMGRPETNYLQFAGPATIVTILESIIAFLIINTCFILMVSEKLQRRLNAAAVTDVLTNLFNRRAFYQFAARELSRATRYGMPISLLIVDLDRFKSINDRYGHAAGDDVLRCFANLLRGSIRDSDLAARLGGEEFAVLLYGTGAADALAVAERLREDSIMQTVSVGQRQITFTVSIGVCAIAKGQSLDMALMQADQALYVAKNGGRNRSVLWHESREKETAAQLDLEWA